MIWRQPRRWFTVLVFALITCQPGAPAAAQPVAPPTAPSEERPPERLSPQARTQTTLAAYSGNSGIAPPEANDSRFTVDTGSYLDQYLFRSQVPNGRLPFTIDITRYYSPWIDGAALQPDGRLKTEVLRKLVDQHLLPERATLELRVYDVDHDSSPCPEVDHLYLNGQPVLDPNSGARATLSSGNTVWSRWSVSVPIELLRFPTAKGNDGPPDPATNLFEIDVDVACGENWAVELDWAALSIESPIRPILFAHGWTGDTNTFNSFADYANTDGIPTAGQADLLSGIETIASTSPELANAVTKARLEYGVDKVNIFAHSKGGLVARHMLRDSARAKLVDHLITFSSPHHGSDWPQSWPVSSNRCGTYADEAQKDKCYEAARELSEERIREGFNFVKGSCKKSGWFGESWTDCQSIFVEQSTGAAYRTLIGGYWFDVGQLTATLPWDADAAPFPNTVVVDGDFGLNHNDIIAKEEPYRCAISYLNEQIHKPSNCKGKTRPASNAQLLLAASERPQLIADETLTLAGSGTAELRVPLDSGSEAAFSLVSDTPVTFLLIAPSGQVYSPASSDAEVVYSAAPEPYLGPSAWSYHYRISAPKTGQWRLTMQADGAVQAQARAEILSPVQLDYRFARADYRPGEQVRLEAALGTTGGPIANASLSGVVTLPAGPAALNFSDLGTDGDTIAGDGIHTALFTAPLESAHLALQLTANQGGTQRTLRTSIEIAAQTARLTGVFGEQPRDANGNGLYDSLDLSLDLDVLVAGHYELIGTLADNSGAPIATTVYQTRAAVALATGNQRVILSFDGAAIAAHGQNGPYRLINVTLIDQRDASYTVDTATELYSTSPYQYQEFERPLIMLTSGSELPIDTAGDSRYDELLIDLSATVVFPGFYQWNGRLIDQRGVEIGWYVGSGSLGAGEPMTFRFPGNRIGESGADGPYLLADVSVSQLSGGSASALIDTAYTTAPYSYLEFTGGVPGVSLNASSAEVYESAGQLSFEVNLNATIAEEVRVDYATSDGSSTAGSDYVATAGTLVFAPGERAKTVIIPLLNDAVSEPNESFSLQLLNPVGPIRLRVPALATIAVLDNDAPPVVRFERTTATQLEASGSLTVELQLSFPADQPIQLLAQTRDESAVAGADYVALDEIVVFAPGNTIGLLTLTLIDDSLSEAPESFLVNLSAPTGATLGAPSTLRVTISDSDPPPAPATVFKLSLPILRR